MKEKKNSQAGIMWQRQWGNNDKETKAQQEGHMFCKHKFELKFKCTEPAVENLDNIHVGDGTNWSTLVAF